MSDSLWPHGLEHTRLPCPSLSHGICSNSCSLSWWWHPAVSSSVTPLFLLSSIFSRIRVFSNELALHRRWPKDWNLSFTFSPSSEYSGLISVRMDWFDLFAVQGTLKSLLQHHSLKASIFRRSIRKFLTSLWHLNRRVYFSLLPLCMGCCVESFLHWVRSLLPWGSAFFRCQGLPRS